MGSKLWTHNFARKIKSKLNNKTVIFESRIKILNINLNHIETVLDVSSLAIPAFLRYYTAIH